MLLIQQMELPLQLPQLRLYMPPVTVVGAGSAAGMPTAVRSAVAVHPLSLLDFNTDNRVGLTATSR